MLHSSVFARLASGAFYETIVLLTFYDFINFRGLKGGSGSDDEKRRKRRSGRWRRPEKG